MKPKIDLSGQLFGKLTVLNFESMRKTPNGSRCSLWRCRCECGNETIVTLNNLRRGGTKSCGCGMHRNKGMSFALPGKPTWLNNAWQSYNRGAKERKLSFELTVKEVERLILQNCTYCGAEPRNGIDRKDSSLGYNVQNCVPCCTTCNVMKMAMNVDTFIQHVKRIASHVDTK